MRAYDMELYDRKPMINAPYYMKCWEICDFPMLGNQQEATPLFETSELFKLLWVLKYLNDYTLKRLNSIIWRLL